MSPTSKLHRFLERITAAPVHTLLLSWIGIVVGWGVLYFFLEMIPGHGLTLDPAIPAFNRLLNSIYFSIVTATTIGYGDITPVGISKIFVSIEAVFAYGIFAIVVTKLVSLRQERAVDEVHRLSHEDMFRNTREGLYIVRKDLDHLIQEVETHGTLCEHSWENLAVAYIQAQAHTQEILNFYQGERYTIDPKRGELLIEAVQRTMHRINQLLTVMNHKHMHWKGHPRSYRELEEFLAILQKIMPLWSDRVGDQRTAIQDIVHIAGGIHEHITNALPHS
jgi:hypothetical protein